MTLTNILQTLIKNNIPIDDLSAVETSLEEIFLKMVNDESNN
jgi:ABC-2 type transport system ATP-binding protein